MEDKKRGKIRKQESIANLQFSKVLDRQMQNIEMETELENSEMETKTLDPPKKKEKNRNLSNKE